MNFPIKLHLKLEERKDKKSLRSLKEQTNLTDFSSNDYLGFAKSEEIFEATHQFLIDKNSKKNGATGSRLLSGNHRLYTKLETFLAEFHHSESALVFNSGYDANLGLFASVPQKGDIILYDELIHASIRDGLRLSNAQSYKFEHNNTLHLEALLKRFQNDEKEIYVVTESVFSMDGDTPNLLKMSEIIKKYKAFFIVDEAHSLGIFGKNGNGLVQQLGLEKDIFARIITFGKALGCHGATIVGSKQLTEYLINFSRSFIYTTGLSPHSVATILTAYTYLKPENTEKLQENIQFFKSEIKRLGLPFIKSNSAIQCCIIGGNQLTKQISELLQQNGFDVKPILSPTVPIGKERLRFCIHSYNSFSEITKVLVLLNTCFKK